jgi:hypothetical protein
MQLKESYTLACKEAWNLPSTLNVLNDRIQQQQAAEALLS